MAVFLLHGIVEPYVHGASAYRNYVAREAFEAYLRSRRVPFAGWSADGADGDVLTVDDATRAGADACMSARRLGHEVMFFVNPYQIASGQPYFFSVLDAVIDARTAASVAYRGKVYDLTGPAGVRQFALAARAALMVKPAPEAYRAAGELSALLGAAGAQVETHAVPISRAELVALKDAGVRIENHGWSHMEISALTDGEFAEHVSDGREWLRDTLSVEAKLYAVPFGSTDVPAHLRQWVADGYLLASNRFPRGRLGPLCWNRRDLMTEMRGAKGLAAYVSARAASRAPGGQRSGGEG
jgi:hypothetical protein